MRRRSVLGGLLAGALAPGAGWADAGAPAFLSAARRGDGAYRLIGLSDTGAIRFSLPLPARGHAAAAHPTRPLAIAFARRPGTFALAVDCAAGRVVGTLQAPEGRHFYGHGTFSADGTRILTTENDYEAARGVIGIWDTATFTRIAEVPSGGIGPHEIVRTDTGFAVANGGIETHPDSGRTKLNLATMRSNLTYLDEGLSIKRQIHLTPEHRLNSIRHIAYTAGRVAMGMQWQGQGPAPAIVAVASHGGVQMMPSTDRALQGYTGSVAISSDGRRVASTHPRGNAWLEFGAGATPVVHAQADVGGVASLGAAGFAATSGTGIFAASSTTTHPGLAFDNHLIRVA
ncbi:MAG: DUF1513 domain-containing protein [Shimia sp.]